MKANAAAAGGGGSGSTENADYYASESLYERMKKYANAGGVSMDYFEKYANQLQQSKPAGSSTINVGGAPPTIMESSERGDSAGSNK